MKENISNKRKWIIGVVVLLSITLIGVGVFMVFNLIMNPSVSYTWEDRSSGECSVVEGTYCGKADTLYLHDDRIDAFCSARFSYDSLTEGSISFYFRYDSDVSGDIVMEFYEGNVIFSDLDNMDVALMSNRWYLVDLKFDCETNIGEVWIDGVFLTSGAFTITESDYNDGFVIRTDATGMINTYICMISIT